MFISWVSSISWTVLYIVQVDKIEKLASSKTKSMLTDFFQSLVCLVSLGPAFLLIKYFLPFRILLTYHPLSLTVFLFVLTMKWIWSLSSFLSIMSGVIHTSVPPDIAYCVYLNSYLYFLHPNLLLIILILLVSSTQ